MQNQEQNSTSNSLFIGELIRQVHKELIESQNQREKERQPALFEVETLKIEANFVVTASSEVKGGFDFKILTLGGANLGGTKNYKSEQVHKITLTLKSVSSQEKDSGLTKLEIAPPGKRPRLD